MANPFASIQNAINAAAIGALGNATATIGAASIAGVFDARYQDTLGLANAGPAFRCRSADLSAVSVGASASIGGVNYLVRAIEPDGAGMSALILEAA